MGRGVLIIGRSGAGKSTSVETLDPKSTFIINTANKDLPFRGWKKLYTQFSSKDKTGNLVSTTDPKVMLAVIDIIDKELTNIKTIVIEDAHYMSAFEYMSKIDETGYAKFNSIAKNMYLIFTKFKDLRNDLIIFYLTHEDETMDDSGESKIKAKSIGKLVDNLITLEGLFTVVLHATNKKSKEGVRYFFETQTDGKTTAKSPRGMFEEREIPNDLELVRESVISYSE